jgi:hypothetical protein
MHLAREGSCCRDDINCVFSFPIRFPVASNYWEMKSHCSYCVLLYTTCITTNFAFSPWEGNDFITIRQKSSGLYVYEGIGLDCAIICRRFPAPYIFYIFTARNSAKKKRRYPADTAPRFGLVPWLLGWKVWQSTVYIRTTPSTQWNGK